MKNLSFFYPLFFVTAVGLVLLYQVWKSGL